ncbi:L-type lectin-domain containing receptor kinase IX.1-like [Rutidosis leptorrhynchoides]|uniref:L-type lectin-domain containing receptor kinase IX.1-like n=1 Tax=Rutidosis leptorrhynchoides TaxID=125765 RepID=UPI003A99EBCC
MAILICFLMLFTISYTTSLAFNLTNIRPDSDNIFTLLGDAYISDDGIQVTPEIKRSNKRWYCGRATYVKPLHLWDKTSDELASFSTNFSFVINSYPQNNYADGLTFFLAEDNDVCGLGGAMGLPFDTKPEGAQVGMDNNSKHPFVAVEFDTFGMNDWDNHSIGDHVGIDVNSLSSVRVSEWLNDIPNGTRNQAWIEYDSNSKNLSVSFTNFVNTSVARQNGLSYTIDLRNALPEWVIFGFSGTTGDLFEKNTVNDWNFTSSVLQVDIGLEDADRNKTVSSSEKNKTSRNITVVLLISGLLVLVVFLVILAFFFWRKTKKYEDEVEELKFAVEMSNEFEMQATGPRGFSYLELAQSTDDFSRTKKLGEGGFGEVYKGLLKDSNTYVAVKRVSKSSNQGIKEYASEVRIISRLRHRNLVQLKGWCHQKGELLLVYEYLENGSLDSHLFKAQSLLTWETRYKIAQGLAYALLYLHEEWEQCVLHRDIKSSNVMLDSNFNVKLGDFGLAKLVDHDKGYKTTALAGTRGYMAPECFVTGKASKESDVFSFGVVALEIACGRKPIDISAQDNKVLLLKWVSELYGKGTLLEGVDPRLGSSFDEEEIKCLMTVGLWCVDRDPKHRPSIKQVIQVLNSEASLPELPSKTRVAILGDSDLSWSNRKTRSVTLSSIYGR